MTSSPPAGRQGCTFTAVMELSDPIWLESTNNLLELAPAALPEDGRPADAAEVSLQPATLLPSGGSSSSTGAGRMSFQTNRSSGQRVMETLQMLRRKSAGLLASPSSDDVREMPAAQDQPAAEAAAASAAAAPADPPQSRASQESQRRSGSLGQHPGRPIWRETEESDWGAPLKALLRGSSLQCSQT